MYQNAFSEESKRRRFDVSNPFTCCSFSSSCLFASRLVKWSNFHGVGKYGFAGNGELFVSAEVETTKTKNATPLADSMEVAPFDKSASEQTRRRRGAASERKEDPIKRRSFFYGRLPRQDVELMLLRDGEFLVRKTQKKTAELRGMCISTKSRGKIYHKTVKLEDMEFSTVDQLVRYYLKTQKPLIRDMQIIISRPVHRADWVLYNDQIELIKKLGEGNYGEVWKAICTKKKEGKKMKKEVAVKFFKDLEVVNEEEKDFFGECRKQKQLSHLHVVKFIGIVMNSERPKLVMELCDSKFPGTFVIHQLLS
ncbi:Pkinase Tyr and SH2 domain containing protein [Trichuris trichiura]|uniref:Tyrosine-protein kinase n=1 Tax=Trichuris trichiura TaxID=36087 RepID=A0A077Z2H5_TRITR|nr:Pkinase Tyr and SH2 domain containing protein [Trichuris trichiura]